MTDRGKKLLKRIARTALCGVLLVWIINAIFKSEAARHVSDQGGDWEQLSTAEQRRTAWTEGPRALAETFRKVDIGWFTLSLVFMGGTIAMGAVRWRRVLLAQSIPLPFGRCTEISMVAHFFNSFLLGNTGGDLLKAYYAARETHTQKVEAVASVVLDRIVGLFSMLLFAGVMMVPHMALIQSHRGMLILAAATLGMLLVAGGTLLMSFRGGLSKLVPSLRNRVRRLPGGATFERAVESARVFGRSPAIFLEVVGLSMALNLLCVLQIWALAAGLGLHVSFAVLLFAVPMIICISALPITPNGLGIRENLYVYVLASAGIGVEPAAALTLSLLAYAGSLLWSLVGGVIYLLFKRSHELAKLDGGAERDA